MSIIVVLLHTVILTNAQKITANFIELLRNKVVCVSFNYRLDRVVVAAPVSQAIESFLMQY